MDAFLTALEIVVLTAMALPLAYIGVRILIAGLFDNEYDWIDAIFGLTLTAVSSLGGGVLLMLLSKGW